MGKFSIAIPKSKHHFFLALLLGVAIILCVVVSASNNVIAQTLETTIVKQPTMKQLNETMSEQGMKVGNDPDSLAINPVTHKIYVANAVSGTVTVIDSGGAKKDIRVGAHPSFVAVDELHNKIYIANKDSDTVSVIDGYNDSKVRDVHVGISPISVAVGLNKIYVANFGSDTVSVIDTSNDTREKHDIRVGKGPLYVVSKIGSEEGAEIYVANENSHNVSVINETTNKVQKNISVGYSPTYISRSFLNDKIYVANSGSRTLSVIDINASKDNLKFLSVTKNITFPYPVPAPRYIIDDVFDHLILVLHKAFLPYINLSVIDRDNDTEIGIIPLRLGLYPYAGQLGGGMALGPRGLWVSNPSNNTVSVIHIGYNVSSDVCRNPQRSITYTPIEHYDFANFADHFCVEKETRNLTVGGTPVYLASDDGMIYVVNTRGSEANRASPFPLGSISVINGSSEKVAAGVTFNTHPAGSGSIKCDNSTKKIGSYLYIDAGTNCAAYPNKDFQFTGWTESLNRNSTIPLGGSSPNLTINRYGTFAANFKPVPPAIPPELYVPLYAIVAGSLIGGSITSIIGRAKARTQRKYLRECLKDIDELDKDKDKLVKDKDKLDKNDLEKKITKYYVDGKISTDHRQLLKDKISEHYESVRDAKRSPL